MRRYIQAGLVAVIGGGATIFAAWVTRSGAGAASSSQGQQIGVGSGQANVAQSQGLGGVAIGTNSGTINLGVPGISAARQSALEARGDAEAALALLKARLVPSQLSAEDTLVVQFNSAAALMASEKFEDAQAEYKAIGNAAHERLRELLSSESNTRLKPLAEGLRASATAARAMHTSRGTNKSNPAIWSDFEAELAQGELAFKESRYGDAMQHYTIAMQKSAALVVSTGGARR